MDSAVATRAGEKSAASNSGAVVNRAPPVPRLMAVIAITAKITRKISSAARNSRLTSAVNEIPM